MLLTVLLLIFSAVGTNGNAIPSGVFTSSVHITSLGSDRPIYYDTIGKVQLIHNEWRLLMYYNLSTYWSGLEKFEKYLQDILNFCKSLEPKYCETTIRQLSHEMELLHHYNNILLAPHKHLSGRNKRGLIDGVGYVANSLFGILDQRFAEQYQNDIQNIQKNENYLLELARNQTSIVEIENTILKKNEQNMNNQFTLINRFMNETDTRFAKIESGIEVAMATAFFTSASLAAHLLLTNLKNIQETLYNTMMNTYKGRIDVHLLTPVNLIQQLIIISGRLPKTLTLPVTNIQDEIKDLYELIYVKARVTDKYFMYELHIPLASDEDFIVYKIFPLPMKSPYEANETTIVAVSSTYLAVNLEKNTYVRFNEKELKSCVQRQTDNFICIFNLPIFNLQNINTPCEAKLLGHQSTSSCITKKTKCDSDWIELHNTNTWLVSCCDSCNIRTVCEGDVRVHAINTSSIVSLKQGCLIQTKDLKIHSLNHYYSNAKLDYDIQIPSLDRTINGIVNTHSTPLLETNHNEDITLVEKRLQYLKDKELLTPTITTHDIHHYAISYFLLAVIGVAIAIWVASKHGYCNKKPCNNSNSQVTTEEIEMQFIKPTTGIRKLFKSRSMMERPHPRTRDGAKATGAANCARSKPTLDVEFNF